MSKVPAALQEKWVGITQKRFSDQAIWVLNGFWSKLEKEAENVWGFVAKFGELSEKKADGCELDEFWSHKFLESLGETMTVIAFREKMRSIDIDFNKKMSVIEYLAFRYQLDVAAVINAPQGGNEKEMATAQEMVAAAQTLLDKCIKAFEEASAAEETNRKALEELQAQEKAYNDKKAELQKIKADSAIGVVKRNKAANELDQLLAEDPLPLRRAKLNQAATLKKAEKARAVAEEAKNAAEAKFAEAMAYLERAKAMGGAALGAIWWMQREITEKKKFMPKSRQ